MCQQQRTEPFDSSSSLRSGEDPVETTLSCSSGCRHATITHQFAVCLGVLYRSADSIVSLLGEIKVGLMRVCDLQHLVEMFGDVVKDARSIELTVGRPWHFEHSYRESHPDFAKSPGVYVYSKPASPDWNLALERNTELIWYIGKSDSNLASRVWSHIGLTYDPETQRPCEPRFKFHQWAQREDVPFGIREAIATAQVVVYTIKVDPLGRPPGLAQALEKFLLATYYRATGSLPPLNLEL